MIVGWGSLEGKMEIKWKDKKDKELITASNLKSLGEKLKEYYGGIFFTSKQVKNILFTIKTDEDTMHTNITAPLTRVWGFLSQCLEIAMESSKTSHKQRNTQ